MYSLCLYACVYLCTGNRKLLECDYVWKKLVDHYDKRGCIKTPAEFPPKDKKKSRQELLLERQERLERRYGDSYFTSGIGTTTFYEGPFD